MARSCASGDGDGESLPLLLPCSLGSSSPARSYTSYSSSSHSQGRSTKISVRRTPTSTTTPLRTPRSPFEEGFPLLFCSSSTSPRIPSPRPHRLSFSYAHAHDRHRQLHVFLTLLMSAVGAGMLSVPYTFALVPMWQAILGIVAVGVAMATTSIALLYAHVQLARREEREVHIGAGRRFSSFQSIAIVAGGELSGYVVSVATAVGVYGGCVGCVRIVRDMAPFVVATASAFVRISNDDRPFYVNCLLGGIVALVVFPLCMLHRLSALRVSSYAGFAFSLYLVVAVVFRALYPAATTAIPAATTTIPAATATTATAPDAAPFSRLTQSLAIYTYAFMMQLNLLPLFVQLRGSCAEPLATSARKMTRSIVGVSACCVALYVVFGVAALHLYGQQLRGNVLLNLESDPFMAVPLVAVFITVVLSFPLLFHPLRRVLEELLFAAPLDLQGEEAELPVSTSASSSVSPSFATWLLLTILLLTSQLALAVYLPGIHVVFALTGASSCLLICFVFPVALFLKLVPWRSNQWTGGSRVLVLGTLTVIVAGFTVVGVDATWYLVHAYV